MLSQDAAITAAPAERASFWDHPVGFWFIFWGELAERASYYGMRTLLALYMKDRLGFSEADASVVIGYFGAAVYILPFIGGYLADHYFGKYRIIVAFSLPYVLGHVLIGIESAPFLYVALALLAMGSGVIKPNISPLMGMTYDQQRPGQTKLRSDAFAMFYFAINVGSAASTFALPLVRDRHGYAVAFLFPAVLMVFALGFFALGKPFYAVETISKARATAQQRREQWLLLAELLGLFIMVPFFWSVFEQQPSTWTFFAADSLDLHFYRWEIPPDQLQFLNPVLILILLPAMTVMWRVLARVGLDLKPTDKMLIGFILTVLSLVVMAAAAYRAESLGKVSMTWEAAAYVLITAAEVCISVVGLELAFAAAPATMKSLITAFWLAMVSLGNLLNTRITPLYKEKLSPGNFFALSAVLMIAVAAAFALLAWRFNRSAAKLQHEA